MSDVDGLREKTYYSFHQKLNQWEWNQGKSIEEGIVIPVVHATIMSSVLNFCFLLVFIFFRLKKFVLVDLRLLA